jgi:hypothetical protein
MQADLHHPVHWMHQEAVAAGHWCRVHMLQDFHFWFYLLVALVIVALLALMISSGGGTLVERELRYYAYPYFSF